MIAFLLAQIGKIKAAISSITGQVSNIPVVKSDTVTITTNGYGFCISNIKVSERLIIGATGISGFTWWEYGGNWVFMPLNVDTSDGLKIKAVASAEYTITYYYFDA